jgi:hypothetical protein
MPQTQKQNWPNHKFEGPRLPDDRFLCVQTLFLITTDHICNDLLHPHSFYDFITHDSFCSPKKIWLCVVTTLELYLSQSILCVERTKYGSNQYIRFDVCQRWSWSFHWLCEMIFQKNALSTRNNWSKLIKTSGQ